MSGTLRMRVFLVVLLVASAAYMLRDTISYYTMDETQKEALIESGEMDEMRKNIIHQGLDLQGGMHVVLEVDLEELIKTRVEDSDEEIETLITSSLEEAQDLVMTARVMLGWVNPDDLVPSEEEAEE